MLAKLIAPYPAPEAGRASLLRGLFMGLFVGCFLLYFRPFGMRSGVFGAHEEYIAFFGVITLAVSWVLESFLPWVFPAWFNDRNWRAWHTVVFYLFLLLVIATLNGIYLNYVQELSFSWGNYAKIIGQTFALGILPVTLIVLFQYNARLAENLSQAMNINANARGKTVVSVPSDTDGEQLLAVEALGNYVKLHFATESGSRQEVARNTLNQVVEQFAETGLMRCHRSFAVVPDQVVLVNGNAQGLRLKVGGEGLEIPVSRTFLPAVRAALG